MSRILSLSFLHRLYTLDALNTCTPFMLYSERDLVVNLVSTTQLISATGAAEKFR